MVDNGVLNIEIKLKGKKMKVNHSTRFLVKMKRKIWIRRIRNFKKVRI
jgi:hypothetical protein